jgi:hypothetical protein
MARLAEYMHKLAEMFGEDESVHFVRLDEGSTCLVAKIDGGTPSQRVYGRIRAVRDSAAPEAAMRAFQQIDDMVGQDRGHARLTSGAGAVVLRFPGRKIEHENIVSIVQQGTVTGRLYALMEDQEGDLRARIRPRQGNSYIPCTVKHGIRRELRHFLLDAVRVSGRGTWVRGEDGEWSCRTLHIEGVQPVKDASLREAINSLRAIEVQWPDDPLGDWAQLEERDGAA